MKFEQSKFYHFYNRSNNGEIVFKNDKCFELFLQNYDYLLHSYITTYAYCLMPTHFHFLIQVQHDDQTALRKNIAALLSSYTKHINRAFHRHGSLFQPRSKAIEIDDERYLLTLLTYIHQNPIRAHLVTHPTDWEYSSFKELAGLHTGSFVNSTLVDHYFQSKNAFLLYSEELLTTIKYKYWV